MGVVYRAVDVRLRREVALKILPGAIEPREVDDFVREARAAARVRHPGIVVIYSAEVIDGLRVVALELVAGGSLAQRLKRDGAMPSRTAAALVAELAAAVEAAHREGVVHRDLKPANVLLELDGRPRLTDFGLARDEQAGMRSATGDIIGTPAYMAPEQARGDVHRVGPWTDVWGLGTVLFECLTGERPFTGRTGHEVLGKILREDAPSPSSIRKQRGLEALPLELSTICATALARDPTRRYASAGALEADLRRWLDGRPICAQPPTRLLALLDAWRRHRRSLAVGAAAAVTTAVAIAVVPGLLGGAARRREHAAVLAAVGSGEGRVQREKAVFELTKDGDRAAVPLLIAALAEVTARLTATTEQQLLAVLEPRDADERPRQARIAPLREALASAAAAAPEERLDRAHVRAIEEARRRLALRAGGKERAATLLALEHRRALGDELLRAGVAAEALGLLGDATASDALGRYLHAEEDEERARVAVVALGRLKDARAARAVLRLDERFHRGGQLVSRAMSALARELGGVAPAFEPATGLEHLDRGRLRALLDDLEGAMSDFEQAVTLAPDDPLAYGARAGMHLIEQRFAQATADLERAVALDPEDPALVGDLAYALFREGQQARAQEACARALELDPLDARGYVTRGDLRSRAGDYVAALADLNRAIELDPASAAPWVTRGWVRREVGDLEGAIADSTHALTLDPDSSGAWTGRAVARQQRGDLEGALADLERAIELEPKSPSPLVHRARLHTERRDFAAAIADTTRALELTPGYAGALSARGRARQLAGDLEGARADLQLAVEADPQDASAWTNWGLASFMADRPREALRAFDRAVELKPHDATVLTNRGIVRLQLRDVEGARDDCREAAERDPRNPVIWRNLADAEAAYGDLHAAVEAITQSLVLAPTVAASWRERGRFLSKLGDTDGAIVALDQAIELDRGDLSAWGLRGQAQRARGDLLRAIADYEQMLALMGSHRDAPMVQAVIDELRAELRR
jgi:serine/threonine-protein kinase